MARTFYLVDAFADRPFVGNPAAVCLLDAPVTEEWMQGIAAETGVADTAFLYGEPGGFSIRWFTPATEVPLCGHATLAAAHVLWEEGLVPGDEIRFRSPSDVLYARRVDGRVQLDFPADEPRPIDPPPALLAALGVSAGYAATVRNGYLLDVGSEETLRGIRPDMTALAACADHGVIVTARSDNDAFHFVSRFFAPAAGVDEDNVTGSAHCSLAVYWSRLLGTDEFTAFQASKRGGVLGIRLAGARVLITGAAVTILRGQLAV